MFVKRLLLTVYKFQLARLYKGSYFDHLKVATLTLTW